MNLRKLDACRLTCNAADPLGSRLHALFFRRAMLALVLGCALTHCAVGQGRPASSSGEPIAIIDGQPIYESQLPSDEQAQLQRMLQQVYSVKLRALHAVLDQKLVEAAARKKGVSAQDLVKTEVLAGVADPTDDQVSAYYREHPNLSGQPYDQIKDKIRQGMKEVEIQRARLLYTQGLFQQAVDDGELTVLMRPPKVDITADPARIKGDVKAPVTIVEFSDFSCVYCRRAEATMNDLLAKYPGKVRIAYRDFPLSNLHPHAKLAAEASRCAGEQGKYWQYHDLLFATLDKQTHEDLLANARTLQLDDKQLEACLASGRYRPSVEQDMQLGTRGGVIATPGFFINGTFIDGAQPAAAFEKVIDHELLAVAQKHATGATD